MQRNTLNGWLLLIDSELHFIRLLTALVVSITFLIALLACNPYRKSFDHFMAAGCQLLFVCTFLAGMVVRLYEDIAVDSQSQAYHYLGLRSSEEVVTMMILAAFGMIFVLAFTIAVETRSRLSRRRREAKFSVCTMDPVHCVWKTRQIYGCFLSHFKMGQ